MGVVAFRQYKIHNHILLISWVIIRTAGAACQTAAGTHYNNLIVYHILGFFDSLNYGQSLIRDKKSVGTFGYIVF